jgi:DNA-binding NarL/FixJ family response regulator/signal transduction histidine kinase
VSASTSTIWIRTLAQSPKVRDATAVAVAFGLTLALLGAHGGSSRSLDALGAALAAIACFPLLAHRRAPLAVFALTTAASATLNGLDYGGGPPFGPTFALFFVATDERTEARIRQTTAVVLGLFAIHVGAATIAHPGFPTTPILFGIVLWGGAWVIADQLRHRRQRLADLEQRARRAERETERERRLAAAEERTRIARDLHDSAAHAINVILVHAGAARLLQRRDPDAVQTALTTIEHLARETIGEIDQLVRGLREEGRGDGTDDAIEPPTGLAAVETLAQRHRAAGVAMEIRVDGRPRPLAPALDQSAYRILQESLTNAARHGSGRADVQIAYGQGHLELAISNPLPPRQRRGGARWARNPGDARARCTPRRHPRSRPHRRALPCPHPPALRRQRSHKMNAPPVRVLLVDDDDLMRAGLRAVLSSDATIEVVGEASNGRAAVSAVRAHSPQLVLMDVRMPDLDGIAATREVLAAAPEVRVVILTTFEQNDYIFGALNAGASGFLLKRTRPEELLAAIHTVAAGDSLLSPSVTRIVIDRMANQPTPDMSSSDLEELTAREREVLELVARGLSNREIAAALVIEESTVKTHVKRILMKLHLRDRVHAVIFAYERGVTQPGPKPAA